MITHIVKEDQDIFMLAEFYYGNHMLWWVIYHANQDAIGDDPEELPPGLALSIPELEISRLKTKIELSGLDPLISRAIGYYGDITMYFDILDANGLAGNELITADQEIVFLPRGNKPDMRKAEFFRTNFYRERR